MLYKTNRINPKCPGNVAFYKREEGDGGRANSGCSFSEDLKNYMYFNL